MFKNIPFDKVVWSTSSFLIVTFLLSITAVPLYFIFYGMGLTLGLTFGFYLIATGLSITLGYHRLFSHKTFKAHPIVKWFVLFFGAAAFENSALNWSSDHRKHHRHVDDHDDDPYSISRGFWYAHIGWLLFKLRPEPPRDNVRDLEKDKVIVNQDKYYIIWALLSGFILPTLFVGVLTQSWIGALGGFLIAGVLRIVLVQHATFFINSACHYFGNQPYSSKHSARDSWVMALFTFGEGYHNYHHEFEYDYRNGVKPWQFDPTKWTIWMLSKVGLAKGLKTVPDYKIVAAEYNQLVLKAEKVLVHLNDTKQLYKDTAIDKVTSLINTAKEHLPNLKELSKKELTHLRKSIRQFDYELQAFIASLKPSLNINF